MPANMLSIQCEKKPGKSWHGTGFDNAHSAVNRLRPSIRVSCIAVKPVVFNTPRTNDASTTSNLVRVSIAELSLRHDLNMRAGSAHGHALMPAKRAVNRHSGRVDDISELTDT